MWPLVHVAACSEAKQLVASHPCTPSRTHAPSQAATKDGSELPSHALSSPSPPTLTLRASTPRPDSPDPQMPGSSISPNLPTPYANHARASGGAGTVAPGVYSESACKPNFLQVENPARFFRGRNAALVRALTWHYLLAVNLFLLVLPLTLRADYSHNTIPLVHSFADVRNLATVVFWVLLLALLLYALANAAATPPPLQPCSAHTRQRCGRRRRRRLRRSDCGWLLSLALLVAPFVPSSNLLFPVGFVVAERVLYMPSLSFCMLQSLFLDLLLDRHPHATRQDAAVGGEKRRVGAVGARGSLRALLVLAYAGRTWVRNYDWRSREGFFGAMVRATPDNPKAHYGYGNVVINDVRRKAVGERHLLEASRLQPNYFDAYNDLGACYNRDGDWKRAAEQFEYAVAAKPEHINGLRFRV